MPTKIRNVLRPLLMLGSLVAVLFAGVAFAAAPNTGVALSSIASHVDASVKEIATVLSDVSLIAGVGFVMASFFKFHQHKLNPTQVPISQGVTLLLIGAGLIIFPSILPTAKRAVFGDNAEIAKVGGDQIQSLIGK